MKWNFSIMITTVAAVPLLILFLVEVSGFDSRPDGSQIVRKLQKIRSFEDIVNNFKLAKGLKLEKVPGQVHWQLTDKHYARGGGLRVNVDLAKQAPCKPRKKIFETQTISIPGHTVLWPRCIAYRVCGGCCTDMTRECGPSRIKERRKNVVVVNLEDSTVSYQIHKYQEHTKCSCNECRIKPHHCRGEETYFPDQCRCECVNVNTNCGPKKQWSPVACKCICSNQHAKNNCVGAEWIWHEQYCQCVKFELKNLDTKKK